MSTIQLTRKDLFRFFRSGTDARPEDFFAVLRLQDNSVFSLDWRYRRNRDRAAMEFARQSGMYKAIGRTRDAMTMWRNAVFMADI